MHIYMQLFDDLFWNVFARPHLGFKAEAHRLNRVASTATSELCFPPTYYLPTYLHTYTYTHTYIHT